VETAETEIEYDDIKELRGTINQLEKEMRSAAKDLAFEEAARLRDRIKILRKLELEML